MPSESLFYMSYAALWALVLFQTLVMLEVVRRNPNGRPALEGLQAFGSSNPMLESGSPAPTFEATDIHTGAQVSPSKWAGQRLLLGFLSPECSTCIAVSDELVTYSKVNDAQLVVVCRGTDDPCKKFSAEYFASFPVIVDEKGSISEKFLVEHTPTAVIIDEDGRILRYGFPRPTTGMGLSDLLEVEQQRGATNGRAADRVPAL
ncbi:MAG: peroxiredoxin family protein [Chloroflexota bacterium]